MAKYPDNIKENVIQWITGDDFICCTLTQRKYITKVRKIAVEHPNLVPFFHENKDGSIYCHLPLKCLKLSLITRKESTFSEGEEIEQNDEI